MNGKKIDRLVLVSLSAIFFIALVWWFSVDPTADFVESIPGLDNQAVIEAQSGPKIAVNIGEHFQVFAGIPANLRGSWPRFRGADFDNISKEQVKLADNWPASGPEAVWSIELGEGHAAPAIHNGRVYLLDYDETQKAEALRCLSLADGQEIWRRWYKVPMKRNHGLSRTIPAVTDSFVVTIGPKCHVLCVTSDSGKFLWGIDLEQDFETEIPFWYTGQCPLIDDSLAILAPGGKALMIAVHCRTGKIVWQTPNPDGWKMSHSSIMPMTLNGRKMYVYCAIGGIFGVAAAGENRGMVLWKTSVWNPAVIAPSPVIFDDGRIFATAGYGSGAAMFRVKAVNENYEIEVLQQYKPDEGLASEQQTPILFQDHLFAILPKDGGTLRNQLVCVRPEDCKNIRWSSGKTNRFGLGPFIIADGKIFLLNDEGTLHLLKAGVTGYQQLAQAKVLDGQDAWGPMALANGYLLLRDSKKMICLDVRAK